MITNNEMVMPVAPMYGGGNGGFGNGGFGGDWGWIILLLLLAGGGWGNGFGGFGGGFAADGAALYPWMNQADITTSGFQNAATNSAIASLQNSVTSGFGDVQTALCGGFAGVNASISNGFAQSEIADNARQIANMQSIFGVQSALQNCCCENRANIADLKYTVATENCADRAAVSDGIRDIITNQTANTQRILDQLCADKIDAKNEKIADLERKLTLANLSASQIAQTAEIQRGQVAEVDALYNRLVNCPIPSEPVYGRQPIFTCPNNNNGCGCGCNGGF